MSRYTKIESHADFVPEQQGCAAKGDPVYFVGDYDFLFIGRNCYFFVKSDPGICSCVGIVLEIALRRCTVVQHIFNQGMIAAHLCILQHRICILRHGIGIF